MSPVNKFKELLMSIYKLHPDGSLNSVNSTNIDSVLLKCQVFVVVVGPFSKLEFVIWILLQNADVPFGIECFMQIKQFSRNMLFLTTYFYYLGISTEWLSFSFAFLLTSVHSSGGKCLQVYVTADEDGADCINTLLQV